MTVETVYGLRLPSQTRRLPLSKCFNLCTCDSLTVYLAVMAIRFGGYLVQQCMFFTAVSNRVDQQVCFGSEAAVPELIWKKGLQSLNQGAFLGASSSTISLEWFSTEGQNTFFEEGTIFSVTSEPSLSYSTTGRFAPCYCCVRPWPLAKLRLIFWASQALR